MLKQTRGRARGHQHGGGEPGSTGARTSNHSEDCPSRQQRQKGASGCKTISGLLLPDGEMASASSAPEGGILAPFRARDKEPPDRPTLLANIPLDAQGAIRIPLASASHPIPTQVPRALKVPGAMIAGGQRTAPALPSGAAIPGRSIPPGAARPIHHHWAATPGDAQAD